MTLNEYQTQAERTAGVASTKNRVLNCGLGLTGEAGEVADIIKKVYFQGHALDDEKLANELGDVLWYIAILAQTMGWNLEDIAKKNIAKLSARYPQGFDEERSRNREE